MNHKTHNEGLMLLTDLDDLDHPDTCPMQVMRPIRMKNPKHQYLIRICAIPI